MATSDRSVIITVLLAMFIGVLAVGMLSPLAAADSHVDSDNYVVEQGEQCIEVDAYEEPDRTVEEFYDYRSSETDPEGQFSSYGTIEEQADDTSILLLHEGSEGLSLVLVHDQYHGDEEDGTHGGAASFVITGITPGEEWEVEDDDYGDETDEFHHGDTHSEIHWVWTTARTDGGAYTGLGADLEDGDVTIEPAFNESAELYNYYDPADYPGYNGNITDWQVISAEAGGEDFERHSLNSLEEDVTISTGTCDDESEPPAADLTVDDNEPEIGEDMVTLDASDSAPGDAPISEYRWDVTGDGGIDETTTDATYEHVFEDDVGEREVAVTVVDENGQNDTASVTVTVVDETPPTAVIDAPEEATEGESVTFSGAESTDNHELDSYEWAFGDGETATGESVEHTYESPGEYDVQLTVTDPSGNENSTSVPLTIETAEEDESDEPTATLDAPADAVVNEPVTLDASESDVTDNATYEWTVSGETELTEDPTYETSFDETGLADVSVTIEDAGGSDTAEATIEVHPRPDATIKASETSIETGDSVQFDAGDTTGNIERYEWDFDDGETTTGETVKHTFTKAGTYEVSLTVTDSADNTDAETVTIDVQEGEDETDDTDDTDDTDEKDQKDKTDEKDQKDKTDEKDQKDKTDEKDGSDGGDSASDSSSSAAGGYADSDGFWSDPSTSVSPEPIEATAEVDGNEVVITAEDVDSGTPVEADFAFGDAVRLHGLELEVGEDADVLELTLERTDDSVPGLFADYQVFEVHASSDLEAASYDLSVDMATLNENGINASELTVYTRSSEWQSLDTEVTPDGDRVYLSAELGGESTFGIGVDESALSPEHAEIVVTDVEVLDTDAEAGDTFTTAVDLRNDGIASGEREIELTIDGESVDTKRVSVGAGGSETVEFEQQIESPGTLEVGVGDETETLAVAAAEAGDEDGGEATDGDGAGFGAVLALVAVLAATIALTQRRS